MPTTSVASTALCFGRRHRVSRRRSRWTLLGAPVNLGEIAFVNNTQPFEGQQVIDLANVFRSAAHERRQATGGNDLHLAAELGHQPRQDAVNQSDIAVV